MYAHPYPMQIATCNMNIPSAALMDDDGPRVTAGSSPRPSATITFLAHVSNDVLPGGGGRQAS